jgi:Spy/CpxP family protein refolding chaperone
MSDRIRVEVSDRHGTVAANFDLGDLHLTPRQRDQLGALADGLVRDLCQALGRGEHDARAVAIAVLMRQRADEAAYERVAEQRGLLPL